MNFKMSKRVDMMKNSIIRQLLSLCDSPEMISFAGGFPAAELFPIEEFKKASIETLDEDGRKALQYAATDGYPKLREHIVDIVAKQGIKCNIEDILITNGSQQGLEFSGRIFLDEGDTILVESPSYLGALGAFRVYNPNFVEVETDQNGMRMDSLEEALEKYDNIKFIYTIPEFQNPTGLTMPVDRRKKMIELAKKYNVPIIEDSPYGRLRFEGEILPAIKSFDDEGYVIYLGTFSKIFAPGLRIGYVIANEEILSKYNTSKQNVDLQAGTNSMMQLSKYLDNMCIDDHICKITEVYKNRRDLMIRMMDEYFPENTSWNVPEGGLFTWVTLPENVDATELFKKGIARNVAFVPGEPFYPNGGHRNHFRLNYSCMPEEKIEIGMKRLAELLCEECK